MHFPRKRFGQHFLVDKTIIQKIIAALAPKANDHLVEIGPGRGALTFPVLKKIHQLSAIELDRDLIAELEMQSKSYGELQIYSADVLDFNFAQIKNDERLLRIFGNLPYNISTPLIFHLLDFAPLISDMVFMLQKELADRMAASAGSKVYGRLSVMVQYHCQIEHLFNVPKQAFYPPPQVAGSIVRLTPFHQNPYDLQNYSLFSSIVKHAFMQRRKTLRNSLKDFVSDEVWTHISLPSDLRAENLSVKDFVDITHALLKWEPK